MAKTNAGESSDKIGFSSTGLYDRDIYGPPNMFAGYVTSINPNEEDKTDEADSYTPVGMSCGATSEMLQDSLQEVITHENHDPFTDTYCKRIANRLDDYHRRQYRLVLISPPRNDPFYECGKTPDLQKMTYADIMQQQELHREEYEVWTKVAEKAQAGQLQNIGGAKKGQKRAWHWDQSTPEIMPKKKKSAKATPSILCNWDEVLERAKSSDAHAASRCLWESTPGHMTVGGTTPGNNTPVNKKNRWDETPKTDRGETPSLMGWEETIYCSAGKNQIKMMPTPGSKHQSRWDETPFSQCQGATPTLCTSSMPGATPNISGVTPAGNLAINLQTPSNVHLSFMSPEQVQAWQWEDERNCLLSDDELDTLLPLQGFKILKPQVTYQPIKIPTRKLTATPTPIGMSGFYFQMEDNKFKIFDSMQSKDAGNHLPFLKPEDVQYFSKLLEDVDESMLSSEEQKERKIMCLLLKIKNGTPPMRKSALRQITSKAQEFGADSLFSQILPLMMSPMLEDQERHLLVKVIDRLLYKLDDLVRPYVHKILVVIEPLLIDEDYYARAEGREIISNLAKAAGLATMISTMRPDIDNIDEYVRNTTARAFAVVASALGIPSLLPFLKAICHSKKYWQARHTGIKIVQQIAILMGCAILPHLKNLVEVIKNGLLDEQQKVQTITALALAALAEAAIPYGIESFDSSSLERNTNPSWKRSSCIPKSYWVPHTSHG